MFLRNRLFSLPTVEALKKGVTDLVNNPKSDNAALAAVSAACLAGNVAVNVGAHKLTKPTPETESTTPTPATIYPKPGFK